jgi:hypothetical protein
MNEGSLEAQEAVEVNDDAEDPAEEMGPCYTE